MKGMQKYILIGLKIHKRYRLLGRIAFCTIVNVSKEESVTICPLTFLSMQLCMLLPIVPEHFSFITVESDVNFKHLCTKNSPKLVCSL